MIRTLRWRLVLVTMALLTVVLMVVIGLFVNTTYKGMEEDSLIALEQAGEQYGVHVSHEGSEESKPKSLPSKPDEEKGRKTGGDSLVQPPQSVIPCFVVGYDHEGQLYTNGSGYYDLTDQEELAQLVLEAQETGEESGLLSQRSLRFLRLDEVCGDAYAFTDVTSEMEALIRLLKKGVLIGCLAMLGFAIICMLMSWWATRPVEQVLEQQRQFVADASHELKTPLTVILTNAELLEGTEYSPEEKKKFSGNILTMAKQMRGLVEELLDLARVSNGPQTVQKEPLNLSQLAEDAVLLFEPIYFEAGRELKSQVDAGLQIKGEAQRMRQVLDVLLDNGCKYSKEGTAVKLRVQRSGLKKCLITVESIGDTLTRQECRDIFKRFYRRDPNRSMNHSYGLGLSIARTIVRQHNGTIWVTSKEGVNTFYVRLPKGQSNGG